MHIKCSLPILCHSCVLQEDMALHELDNGNEPLLTSQVWKRNHTTCVFVHFLTSCFNTTVTTVIFTWALSTCSVMISTHAKHMINYHTMVIMSHSHHHLTCMTWTSGENQVTDTNTDTKPTVSNKTVIWSKIDIPRKIACLQLDSLCLNLVVSAFVSFSVTCTSSIIWLCPGGW